MSVISKEALLVLLGDRPIAYHPILAKALGGVEVAVFISQLLYWTGRGKKSGGWIFKTQAEFEEETGLTRRNQETARKKLKKLSVLSEKLAGVPATMHFRLDLDVLAKLIDQYEQSSLAHSAKLDCTDAPNQNGGTEQTRMADSAKHQRLPEITTKTTTESKKEADAFNAESTESKSSKKSNLESNPEKEASTKKKQPPPQAVEVYRSVARRYPDKATWPLIAEAVGDDPADLERWGEVVASYIACGWNKINIKGMLEFFRKNKMPGEAQPSPRSPAATEAHPLQQPFVQLTNLKPPLNGKEAERWHKEFAEIQHISGGFDTARRYMRLARDELTAAGFSISWPGSLTKTIRRLQSQTNPNNGGHVVAVRY